MTSMDARRLELYELLKPKLDEAPARALVLALPPDPDSLAAKADLPTLADRVSGRMDSFEARLDGRMDSLESRMDARFARMEATLTRRMITIMGAWTLLFGSTVGWAVALLR